MLQLFIWSTPDTIVEARELLADLIEMGLSVQFPESRRGLYKSRSEVNMYFKRFVATCFSRSDKKDDDWAKLAKRADKEMKSLVAAKDIVAQLDNLY